MMELIFEYFPEILGRTIFLESGGMEKYNCHRNVKEFGGSRINSYLVYQNKNEIELIFHSITNFNGRLIDPTESDFKKNKILIPFYQKDHSIFPRHIIFKNDYILYKTQSQLEYNKIIF